jgi:ATP-dependent Clp protease ATP-binding subunit ClpA
MMIGREVEEMLHKVFVNARANGTRKLLPEHLLRALLSANSLSDVWLSLHVDCVAVDQHLAVILDGHSKSRRIDEDDVSASHEFRCVIQSAILRTMKEASQREVRSLDLLIALSSLRDLPTTRVLIESGFSTEKLVDFESRM